MKPGDQLATRKLAKALDVNIFWEYDRYNTWNLKYTGLIHPKKTSVHAFIQKRPHYCDRGHYQLNIEIFREDEPWGELDPQDGFPRYYMNFETAILECELFLIWRLLKIPNETEWFVQ